MKKLIIDGVDEVGRGCLAGPVVSAAVILKEGIDLTILKDSKRVIYGVCVHQDGLRLMKLD